MSRRMEMVAPLGGLGVKESSIHLVFSFILAKSLCSKHLNGSMTYSIMSCEGRGGQLFNKGRKFGRVFHAL